MSIVKIPNKGLEIDMEDFIRLRPYMDAPDFWHLDNQNQLRKWLAPFLPKMDYDVVTGKVTATLTEDGQEWLSQSEEVKEGNFPIEQLASLNKTLEDLRKKVDSQDVDENVRTLIKAFSLPDPVTSPEMYRIFTPSAPRGKKAQPRLAILWGMEKKANSSIPVTKMEVAKAFKVDEKALKHGGNRYLWFFILILLAIIAYLGYDQFSDQKKTAPNNQGQTTPPIENKKADDKKADDKKADDKKADDKKADDTKADDTKPDDTKADDKQADDTKADDKKADPNNPQNQQVQSQSPRPNVQPSLRASISQEQNPFDLNIIKVTPSSHGMWKVDLQLTPKGDVEGMHTWVNDTEVDPNTGVVSIRVNQGQPEVTVTLQMENREPKLYYYTINLSQQ